MMLFRVSFTGELGYEINVPADSGRAVWEAVYEAGIAHGITPYGTETMHVLRAEKGYIIVGQDTDGTVTPDDAGLAWAIGREKPDFVGKRSLERAAMKSAGSQAARGPAHARCGHSARGRRAARRDGGTEAADEIDRARNVLVLQRRARPFDCARDGGRRPRAPGRRRCTCRCPRATSRCR